MKKKSNQKHELIQVLEENSKQKFSKYNKKIDLDKFKDYGICLVYNNNQYIYILTKDTNEIYRTKKDNLIRAVLLNFYSLDQFVKIFNLKKNAKT